MVPLGLQTGVRGATEVSEEVAESIDDLIRKRCFEGRFDDVIRIAAPVPEKKKVLLPPVAIHSLSFAPTRRQVRCPGPPLLGDIGTVLHDP
jgi:hypothetical protein